MDKTIGSLEPGKRADLIIVSMASARQTPMYDPLSHLVYVTRGDDVRTTIVNGRVLMRDRKVLTLDENAVLAEARSWATKCARRSEDRHTGLGLPLGTRPPHSRACRKMSEDAGCESAAPAAERARTRERECVGWGPRALIDANRWFELTGVWKH